MSWLKTAIWNTQANKEDFLFHGTIEPIKGDLRPSSMGKILWVAETPDIAQNYIPVTGSSTLVNLSNARGYLANKHFPPNQGFNSQILRQMGFSIESMQPKYDYMRHAISYRIVPNQPTYKDVLDYIENVLGYKPKYGSSSYLIRNYKGQYMPADFKAPGTLFILSGKEKLKILDLTGGNYEDNLMEPTYNKIELFNKARHKGYDGVRINDFAQSDNWGNMGHRSIGLFESGIAKLNIDSIEARNFDWGDTIEPTYTDEFNEWYNKRNNNNE